MSERRIPDLEDLRTHAAPGTLLDRVWRSDLARRRRQRRQIAGGVGLVTIALLFMALRPEPTRPPAAYVSKLAVPTTLDLDAPDAERVDVVGSWNDWQPQAMIAHEHHFTVTLMLPPGRYEYMFLVNGQDWRADPDAPLGRDDGFGHVNSILNI